jgi:hypothetical protein
VDQRDQICREPERYWSQHGCAGDNGQLDCADPVPFNVVSPHGKKLAATGGPIIQLRAPSSEADFLVRAEAAAVEGGGEIHSTPTYRCIQVRDRKMQIGLLLRSGSALPNDYAHNVTVGPVIFGIDLTLGISAIAGRGNLPGIALAAVLGGTYAGGGTCVDNPSGGSCYTRFSRSWTTELRGQILTDILRIRKTSFRLLGDIGVGLESVSTVDSFSDDGLHALLLAGLGISISGHFAFSPSWDLGWIVGALYQVRFRMTQASDPQSENIPFPASSGGAMSQSVSYVGQGVPTMWQPLWISLGLTLAAPLKPH